MRIVKLLFKNINSLKDEHVIDFSQEPLLSSGLFLIAGPTGSGKSTIMDVITLALYNEIPRFGAISKNNIISQGSIITHHTREAYAEVHYVSNNRLYASKWSLAKNRNDNFNDYHMELWDLTDHKALDFKKSEVPDANSKIIGLNYNQFVKSILLSQGEFAQFLKASHAERSELLEKITGTEIYRRLGKASYDKHKFFREKLENEQSHLQMTNVLTSEEIQLFEERVLTIDHTVAENSAQIIALNSKKVKKEEHISLNQQLEKYELQRATTNTKVEAFKVNEERMFMHEKLTSFRGDLTLYNSLSERQIMLTANQQSLSQSIEQLVAQKKKLFVDAFALINVEITAEDYNIRINEFENKVKSYEDELKRLAIEGSDLRKETDQMVAHMDAQHKQWYKELIDPSLAIQHIASELSIANELLAKNGIDAKTNISDLVQKNEAILQQINVLKTSTDIVHQVEQLSKRKEEYNQNLLHLTTSLNGVIDQLAKAQSQRKESEILIEKLRKEKDEAFARRELDSMRAGLKDSEPCPLCGALEHPYCLDQSVIEIGTVEIALQEAIKNETTLVNTMLDSSKKQSTIESQISSCREAIDQSVNQIAKLQGQLLELKMHDKDKEYFTHNIDKLNAESSINRSIVTSLERTKILMPLQARYENLKKILAKYFEKKELKKNITSSSNPLEDAVKIRSDIQQVLDMLIKKETTFKENKKQSDENKSKLEDLGKSIQIGLGQLGIQSIEAANAYLLSDIEYLKLKEEALELVREYEQIKTKLKDTNAKLQNLSNQDLADVKLDNIMSALSEITKNTDLLNQEKGTIKQKLAQDEENRIKTKSLVENIKVLEKELFRWELLKNLIGDATGKNYANYAQELTLMQIIELANIRLIGLTDRYLLCQKNNELYVIDQYLGNIERSVKTLSGGESFILSLALALSLSDLASQNIRLDCLFIDEGFGTLDDESLDTVINTLERLQQESDKTIGIISHVESLKERILTQILLFKNNQGLSSIRIS